ncbi:DUF6719 family protein [Rhodopseudomonas palustris]|uniref:Uncharacterized protein n=1 Tax=Rhodopseudomonas palustris (strain BisB18) TaxID=316056 RepID=Q215N3_RHOPB
MTIPPPKAMLRNPALFAATVGIAALLQATPAAAEQVPREQDIVDLRLGQRILVDDGSCPVGQIKEVLGATLSSTGITRTRSCVPRFGKKR